MRIEKCRKSSQQISCTTSSSLSNGEKQFISSACFLFKTEVVIFRRREDLLEIDISLQNDD